MQPREEMSWKVEVLEVFQGVFERSWPFPVFESFPLPPPGEGPQAASTQCPLHGSVAVQHSRESYF